jgi:hypothetical protein
MVSSAIVAFWLLGGLQVSSQLKKAIALSFQALTDKK